MLTHHTVCVGTADFEFLYDIDSYIRPTCTQQKLNLQN